MVTLVLFDVDGTILRGGTVAHREAFAEAFRTVYGRDISLDGLFLAGRTDTWLFFEALRRDGVPDDEIERRRAVAFQVMARYVDDHLSDLRDRVLPGFPDILDTLRAHKATLGLLTGNLRPIAFAKMRHAGLGGYFVAGGFGGESAVRSDLVPVALDDARQVAGRPFAAAETIIIGDTPLDVEAGARHGTKTVAVATGPFSTEDLAASGPDLVLSSLDEPDAAQRILALVRPAA